MLKSLNKQSINSFINFINKDNADVIIHAVNDKAIDLKEATDISDIPAIASMLLDFKPIVDSKNLDRVGFNVVDHLSVLKYFFNLYGKVNEFVQLEDLYGASVVMNGEKPHILDVKFIEVDSDSSVDRAKASYEAKKNALEAIKAEGESLFYVYTKVEGKDKQQRIVYSWSNENLEKFRSGLVSLAKTINLETQPILSATFRIRKEGYASPIVTSVKLAD